VGKIIQKHHVSGLLEVAYEVTQTERTIRGRGERPTRTDLTATLTPQVSVDKEAVAWACFQKGWRVYATTAPVEKRSLERAVLAYRGLYLIERGFRRLKRQSLALTPMYLKAPTHLTGLSRALRIGRRVLGLLDYKARQALAVAGETMAGLTQGLPKKATATPTAQALLTAVDAISLFPAGGHGYLTPLTGVQRQVLKVLGFSEKIYHCLAAPFLETQLKIRET
jgi:transposase